MIYFVYNVPSVESDDVMCNVKFKRLESIMIVIRIINNVKNFKIFYC